MKRTARHTCATHFQAIGFCGLSGSNIFFYNFKYIHVTPFLKRKNTCHFQNENSKCLRVPYLILGAKKQETFSDFLLSKAVKI